MALQKDGTPQGAETQESQVVGMETSQEPGGDGSTPGGAEKSTPKERNFTQAEMSAQQAASDRQVAEANQRVAQMALQQEIDKAQAAEGAALARDAQAVSEGEMTSAEAAQRRQTRQGEAIQGFARKRQMAQEQAEHQQLSQELEGMYRIRAANILAEEHGIDGKLLLEDETLQTAPAMENKARSLALDKREADVKGTEKFATGITGRTASSVDNMSASEKIRHGLETSKPRR